MLLHSGAQCFELLDCRKGWEQQQRLRTVGLLTTSRDIWLNFLVGSKTAQKVSRRKKWRDRSTKESANLNYSGSILRGQIYHKLSNMHWQEIWGPWEDARFWDTRSLQSPRLSMHPCRWGCPDEQWLSGQAAPVLFSTEFLQLDQAQKAGHYITCSTYNEIKWITFHHIARKSWCSEIKWKKYILQSRSTGLSHSSQIFVNPSSETSIDGDLTTFAGNLSQTLQLEQYFFKLVILCHAYTRPRDSFSPSTITL